MSIPHKAISEASLELPDDAYKIVGWEGVRRILEAASPYLYAQAIDEAVAEFPLETIHAPDTALVWMMRRADKMRGLL